MKLKNILIVFITVASITTIYAQKTKFDPHTIEVEYFSTKNNDKTFTEDDGNTYKIKSTKYSKELFIRKNKKWLKHGVFYEMYKNGTVKKKYRYEDNKKEGEAISYFSNGKIYTKCTFKNNLKEGKHYQYQNNKKNTLYEEKDYVKGDVDGTVTAYYADGIKIRSIKEYKNDEKHGSSCSYLINGDKNMCTYWDNGKKIK